MDHQEDYYGVPADQFDDEEGDGTDSGEWIVVQEGLDGETHTGQATLDGGLKRDTTGGDD